MRRLLIGMLCLLLPFAALAQGNAQPAALARRAEAILAEMALDSAAQVINPQTGWPMYIPADVMEQELLPVLEGQLRRVVEQHYMRMPRQPETYACAFAHGPGENAARLLTEAFAQAGYTPAELLYYSCASAYVALADHAVEESALPQEYDVAIHVYASVEEAEKAWQEALGRQQAWATYSPEMRAAVASRWHAEDRLLLCGEVLLRIAPHVHEDMAETLIAAFAGAVESVQTQ